MSEPGSEAREHRGWLGALVFSGLWALAVVFMQLLAVAAQIVAWKVEEPDVAITDQLQAMATGLVEGGGVPAVLMTVSMALQFPVMMALAWAAARFTAGLAGPPLREAPADLWGARPVGVAALVVASLMGITAGWLPGWVAQHLRGASLLPGVDAVALLNTALTEGPLWARGVMVLVVAVGAPVVEELVFRGALWRMLRRQVSARATWVLTSVLFAAYHMDPSQALPLLFTAFVLGWVRWRTGSVWGCMALHAMNNGLGVAGAVLPGMPEEVGLLPALGTAAATVALAAALPSVAGTRSAA